MFVGLKPWCRPQWTTSMMIPGRVCGCPSGRCRPACRWARGAAPRQPSRALTTIAAVELLADARDLAIGDALAAKRLHEVLDTTGGDVLHVGVLHDGEQDPLAATAGFEQGGEGAALPHLRDLQLQGAHAGVARPGPVTVAVGDPLRVALARAGPGLGGYLGHHRCLHQHPRPLAQEVEVCVRRILAQQIQHVHPVLVHRRHLLHRCR